MNRKYYRVTSKAAPSKLLRPTGLFMTLHNEKGKRAEQFLEKRRPDGKRNRLSGLFVFEDIDCAKWHWAKMKANNSDARLYEVEADGNVLHRGDMQITNSIGETLDDKSATELADKYWAGKMSEKPCVEVLVEGATVKREIPIDKNGEREIWKKAGVGTYEPERESIEDLIWVDGLDSHNSDSGE